MTQRPIPNEHLFQSDDLWTRCDFEVQLGVPIQPEEAEYLPGATIVDGVHCYPEYEDGKSEPKIRRVTFSYPPAQAAVLDPRQPETLRAAFFRAVELARKEDDTTHIRYTNMGVRFVRRSLIRNTKYKTRASRAS